MQKGKSSVDEKAFSINLLPVYAEFREGKFKMQKHISKLYFLLMHCLSNIDEKVYN